MCPRTFSAPAWLWLTFQKRIGELGGIGFPKAPLTLKSDGVPLMSSGDRDMKDFWRKWKNQNKERRRGRREESNLVIEKWRFYIALLSGQVSAGDWLFDLISTVTE